MLLRKLFSVGLAAILLAGFLSCAVFSADMSLSARCAVLMEASTGRVLWQKNADERRGMASTTKIMTVLCALDLVEAGLASLEQEIAVDGRAVGVEGSSIYLFAGERLTLEELLYAVMLQSANDAAAAVAIALAGSVEDFAALMNEKAADLALTDTHFTNPHGLTDENHYTTARELAKITACALENPTFCTISATVRKSISGGRLLVNHNKLLTTYEGCIGGKTGYTRACGRCLVSAARRNDLTLIAVTLDDGDDWRDHASLLDYGFAGWTMAVLTDSEEVFPVAVAGGTAEGVLARPERALSLLREAGSPEICRVVERKRFYYAPIRQGDVLGKLVFSADGKLLAEVNLLACGDVEQRQEKTFRVKIREWIEELLN